LALAGTFPTCTKTVCPERIITGVKHSCQNIKFGKSCNADCADGYEKLGTPRRWKCGAGADGKAALIGIAPSCVPLTCKYNLPQIEAVGGFVIHSHNCKAIVDKNPVANATKKIQFTTTVDGTCDVSCIAPLTGIASTYTCGKNQAFTGSGMPTCTGPGGLNLSALLGGMAGANGLSTGAVWLLVPLVLISLLMG
jgi:hypothetical protein